MENTTITATITYPTADIEAFADRRGYMEMIKDEETGEMVANSQTRVEFVKEWFTDKALELFLMNIDQSVRLQKNQEAQELITQKRNELKQVITVS